LKEISSRDLQQHHGYGYGDSDMRFPFARVFPIQAEHVGVLQLCNVERANIPYR